jgi:hypothetical protein
MTRFAPLLLLPLALLACTPAPVDPEPAEGEGEGEAADPLAHIDDPRVKDIAAAFNVAMKQCPERVWPGHSWDDNAVVLRAFAEDRAWLWTFDSVDEVDPTSLPFELANFSFFSTGLIDNKAALGIDLDIADEIGILYEDFATHLAIHEGFHFLGGQDDFTSTDTGGRDPSLPIDFEPRFLRERLIDAIGRGALDEARYWNDRHVDEFAADAAGLRGLDVIEGTAQYVETVGVIVARLGCDATDAEIAAEMNANIDSFVFDVGYDAGGESYVLGPLAGVALRARDGQGFEEAARGAPLHELLLADVAAATVDEAAHEAARTEAEDAIGGLNSSVTAALAPTLAAWDDVSNVRLALPTGALVGSFGYEGGYFLSERSDELHVLINAFAEFAPNAGDATIDSVTIVEDFVACGEDMFAVAIDPTLATRAGNIATFNDGGIEASAVAFDEIVDAAGATWWCVR